MSSSTPTTPVAKWFAAQLDKSENAEVKRRYLRWHAEDTGASYSDEDPLFTHVVVGSSTGWSLHELLWRARIVAMDGRTLWECLDARMVAIRVHDVVDLWNEQLSVKLVGYFIEEQQREGSSLASSWNTLRTALDQYASSTIKPQGSLAVAELTSPPSVVKDAGRQRVAPTTDTWSTKASFIPMEAGNDYSEGSLCCTAPAPSLSTLLQVPRSEMFFLNSVLQFCTLGRAIVADPSLSDLLNNEEAMLVLCLVYERFIEGAERSHWRRLLRYCPSKYPTMPIGWESGDLIELDGLDMLDDVVAKRGQMQVFADQVQNNLLPLFRHALSSLDGATEDVPSLIDMSAAFAYDHLVWAQCTFDSRAFNLNVDGAMVMALVPLADMVNHSNYTDVLIRRVEPDGGPFTMVVGAPLTDADVGRELWMSYGPLQSWELLQHYGFVLGADNEHDKLPFPLAVPTEVSEPQGESDAIATESKYQHQEGLSSYWDAQRLSLMRRYSLCLPGRFWIPHDGVPPAALLALLRLQFAEADEFDLMKARRYGPFEPLSPSTESTVVSAVQSTTYGVLESFPTTLEEDEETLSELRVEEGCGSGTDDASRRNYTLCLQLRIGLKRIANRTLEWCADHS